MNMTDKIQSLFNKIEDKKMTREEPTPNPDLELKRKVEVINARAEKIKEAFNTYGINKPFTLDAYTSLVDGYDSWWRTIGYNDSGDEKREEVTPIYKFTSKDTIEVVGARISEYDRVTVPGSMSRMSSPRRLVKEIGLDEYKKMMIERQQRMESLDKTR